MENRRLIEDNRIFNEELKMANEFKIEFDRVNVQLKKCEAAYRKKMTEIAREKNMIQVI